MPSPWSPFPIRCAGCGAPARSPCEGCVGRMAPPPMPIDVPGLRSLSALTAYDARSAPFVAAAKFANDRATLTQLGRWIAPLLPVGPAVVTWAPTTPRRRRDRGFDQAEILARVAGEARGLRCRRLLRRRPGPHQTGRSAADRRIGPRFEPRRAGRGAVVLVDDVCTTGSTLAAAAHALREAGFGPVHGVVVALTAGPAD